MTHVLARRFMSLFEEKPGIFSIALFYYRYTLVKTPSLIEFWNWIFLRNFFQNLKEIVRYDNITMVFKFVKVERSWQNKLGEKEWHLCFEMNEPNGDDKYNVFCQCEIIFKNCKILENIPADRHKVLVKKTHVIPKSYLFVCLQIFSSQNSRSVCKHYLKIKLD